MATSMYGESAKIFEFPAHIVKAAELRREKARAESHPICDSAFDSWYHEDAVRVTESKNGPLRDH